MLKKTLKILDLYSGLGGMSIGFELTGAFKTIAGVDNFDWAVKTFYHNHPALKTQLLKKPQDMSLLDPQAVLEDLGEQPDVIVGGPPCQGFSNAGKRLDDLKLDPRNEQVFHFYRFIQSIKPKAFVMENVSGILKTGQDIEGQLLDTLIKGYTEMGYSVSWKLLNAVNYRVPQQRKRIVLVGILEESYLFEFPYPPCADNLFGEPLNTVADALSDIGEPIKEEPQPYHINAQTALESFLRLGSNDLYNHSITKHSPEMIERLSKQQQGTRLYRNWNHSWYRLDPTRPSPTVKENHRAPFVHHCEPRATSPRECARLQTIPDRYVLLGTKTAQLIMVGNAVAPIFMAHIATQLARQVFKVEPPIPWALNENPMLNNFK